MNDKQNRLAALIQAADDVPAYDLAEALAAISQLLETKGRDLETPVNITVKIEDHRSFQFIQLDASRYGQHIYPRYPLGRESEHGEAQELDDEQLRGIIVEHLRALNTELEELHRRVGDVFLHMESHDQKGADGDAG